MLKTFKYRIYPTRSQRALIEKHIGACRFIYNLALETKQTAYAGYGISLSCFELHRQLTDLKREFSWLTEINAQSLQQSITNLDKAYTSFFKGHSNFPVYKKKSNKGGFNIPQKLFLFDNKISLPKFREGIEINLHRPLFGKIKQATISKSGTDKYFASILCETEEVAKEKSIVTSDNSVGIDLGIKTFLVSSDGKEYGNPKFLRKSLSKLKYIDRKLSKFNGKRTRLKLAKIHEKIANQRKDFLHKISIELIKNHDTICIEDLNIDGMKRNHKLGLSINDAGWGMFVRMLEYKAAWYGKNIIRIGRFDPSSKTCSCCGKINKELTLKDREWTCKCGVKHNRDINAAINIKNFALRNYLSGTDRKNRNELPTLVGVLTSEANI